MRMVHPGVLSCGSSGLHLLKTFCVVKSLILYSDRFQKEMRFSGKRRCLFQSEGLYLYNTGDKLPLLCKISQEWRESGKELKIVLVNLHTNSYSFPKVFSRVLAKQDISWWVAPYNFTASIVLERLFEGEKVIIVGPNDLYVDVHGMELMLIYGYTAYPFNFDSVVLKTVEELRQVTLDSFFKLLELPVYPSAANNVLFYVDFPDNICPSVYTAVTRFFRYEDVELWIYISLPLLMMKGFAKHAKQLKLDDCKSRDLTLKMKWHTKGSDKCKNFFYQFFNYTFPTIVAFGEDGRICSLLAHEFPPSDGPEIKGDLLKELSSILGRCLNDYD